MIGYVGSTGYSTGCHLHLMVWLDGTRQQPDDLVLTAFLRRQSDIVRVSPDE